MKLKLFVDYDRAPKLERGKIAVPARRSAGLPNNFLTKRALRHIGVIVRQIIRDENKKVENINVALVSDDFLLDINRKFLNHNYKTDVISFNLGENGIIDGEIYVSVDRAKVQARQYNVPLETEILRLIFHGTLHMAGLNDKTRSEKLSMRKRENALIHRFYQMRRKG